MVYARRRRPTRRPRRRPVMRRRRVLRTRASIHAPKKFCETIQLTNLQSIAGVTNGTGYNFSVSGSLLNNLPVLAGVFSQFAITGVKYMYIPRYNMAYLDADEGVQMPQVIIAENKYNTLTPTAETQLLQEDNMRIFSAAKRWSHYVNKPKAWLTQNSEGNIGTQIQAQTGSRFLQWLPLTESGQAVDHLGLRAWAQGNNSASTFVMGTLYAKVYYAVKEQQ